METRSALRAVSKDLLAFAGGVATYISAIKEDKARIPEDLLTIWTSSDEHTKDNIIKDLFEQGISRTNELVLERTQSMPSIVLMKLLLLLPTGEEFCAKFGQFGEGLKEIRDGLEPKATPLAE